MTNYELEQRYLEATFVYKMLSDYGIQEITTQRQAKNETRAFKMPTGQILASYKSGMVRRCDSSDRIYQLNPKYKTKTRWVFLTENGLETKAQGVADHIKEIIEDSVDWQLADQPLDGDDYQEMKEYVINVALNKLLQTK